MRIDRLVPRRALGRLALLLALSLMAAAALRGGPAPVVVDIPPPALTATGQPDPVANRVAIQALFDKYARYTGAPGEPANPPVVFRFGAYEWPVDRPLRIEGRSFTLRGLGPKVSRIKMAAGGHDVLVLGVQRKPAGVALDPAAVPDAFGKLDASAAPRAGVRHGFRTLGALNLAQAGGGFDQGGPKDAAYGGTRTLLVEAMLDLSNLGGKAFSLAGMREQGPRPWSLVWYGSDPTRPNLIFSWRTRPGGDPSEGTVRNAYIPVPAGLAATTRVTVCLDLDAGRLDCFFDDARVAYGLSGPALVAGESLATNDWNHFGLGGVGAAAMQGHDEIGGDGDVGFFGFRVGSVSPYVTTGATLARKDGQAINDLYRYFRAGADLIGLVTGTDPVADVLAERRVVITSGNGGGGTATSAYVLDRKLHVNPFGGVADVAIENLGVESLDWRYGDAVKIGAGSELWFERDEFVGGARGLALFQWGATYPLGGRALSLAGADCGLHLFMAVSAQFSDMKLGVLRGQQRAQVRAIGSGVTIAGAFCPHWGKPDYGVYGRRAMLTLRDWALDNEGAGWGSQIADVYCWPFEDNQPTSTLVLESFQAAQHGPNASAVILAGPGPKDNARQLIGDASVRVNGLGIHKFSQLRSLVRILPEADGLWRDDGVNLGASKALDGQLRVGVEGTLRPTTP